MPSHITENSFIHTDLIVWPTSNVLGLVKGARQVVAAAVAVVDGGGE